jgi:hypothetical protein
MAGIPTFHNQRRMSRRCSGRQSRDISLNIDLKQILIVEALHTIR